MTDFTIQQEKLAQAVQILNEKNVDAWMTFVQETRLKSDPALGLILGADMTWHSALIVTRTGRKIAIVGRYDVDLVKETGAYDTIIGYDKSIKPDLLAVLDEINPRQIAVNYSENDAAADGLTYGLYLTLKRYLDGKPYELTSAENVLMALRGRKSPSEIQRIRAAIRLTEKIIDEVTDFLRPGLSELEISDFIDARYNHYSVIPSFTQAVNCGPETSMGHGARSPHVKAASGHIVHIDLGLVLDDYVSDIQRVWYLQPAGESSVATPVQKAFDAVKGAVDAAFSMLKPGLMGYQVDDVSRAHIVAAGYPEYQHAVGHHIGRTVHDGSTLLGPRWERYGKSPEGLVEAGNCYTLELGTFVPHYGIVSLEEDVLVTPTGVEWLSQPQTAVIVKKV